MSRLDYSTLSALQALRSVNDKQADVLAFEVLAETTVPWLLLSTSFFNNPVYLIYYEHKDTTKTLIYEIYQDKILLCTYNPFKRIRLSV